MKKKSIPQLLIPLSNVFSKEINGKMSFIFMNKDQISDRMVKGWGKQPPQFLVENQLTQLTIGCW